MTTIRIEIRERDYVTCPYVKCRKVIAVPGDGKLILRCPYCGKGI